MEGGKECHRAVLVQRFLDGGMRGQEERGGGGGREEA